MSRVTTKTGLANLTASLMKVEAVTQIDPPDARSKFAKKANQWYDETRRDVLAEHTWNFALKRVQLPKDATDPAFGYGARYLLPSDYIRLATIGNEDNPEVDYKVEDGYILCDISAPLDLRYVYNVEDVTKFSPKFIQCFARKLKANLVYDMTGNRTMQQEAELEYLEYLSMAKGVDGQESPPTHRIRRSKWKAAKEGRSILGSQYAGRVVT